MTQPSARVTVGDQSWHFDETEWWLLNRHWMVYGTPERVVARLLTKGGRFADRELGRLMMVVRSLEEHQDDPLVVGTDKYPTVSDWNSRWRALLRAQGVSFRSVSRSGEAVFRGKTNLSKAEPQARPDGLDALPQFRSLREKLRAAVDAGADASCLEVRLALTYETF
ncbi:MAG: hypothetical protein KF718_31645 [Polyangiaceae bacterium]|nr:hypothetical protein [Polyangiaceae bacterium]